ETDASSEATQLKEQGRQCATVGILTALESEFEAMRAMLDQSSDFDIGGIRYVVGQIPGSDGRIHPIVLALGDVGESIAAIHTTRLYGHFPNLEALIMVGIAGGAPNPGKANDHVRLGDIVVSDKYGVVQFDLV